MNPLTNHKYRKLNNITHGIHSHNNSNSTSNSIGYNTSNNNNDEIKHDTKIDMETKNKNNFTNFISSGSVNPILWGPLMWNLLHELAKYGLDNKANNANILPDYKNIISSLPHVLPCSVCRQHCKEAYDYGRVTRSITSINKFHDWVWDLKTSANKHTNAVNLSYDNYIQKLEVRTSFLSENDMWDLLFLMILNYPNKKDYDINRQNYYMTFFKSIANLAEHVDSISKFKCLNQTIPIWDGVAQLQEWLIELYKSMYSGQMPDINKYSNLHP